MRPALVRDLALLLARVGVGVVFVAHGWQKFFEWGMSGTTASFAKMGVPLPGVSAWFAGIVELGGGVALLVGAAVPVFGLLIAFLMTGALVLVHAPNGVFVDQGGFELVVALGGAALILAAIGAGRFSVDNLVSPRLAQPTGPAPEREHAPV